ncbi:hypothetical protein CfE428DRAFT_5403 [Chthoniobacter flavus Ellin428]|uniref:NlpC/P60 domain-containing protein n=1 Tax=Chthoniobacter flavus Ellin428 TaxID=497964 RepID=B4D913_9BACT|nr:hypothetical protein [Chthoniobacter flavus]EDY17058.1 hypothetical protein CfE428DRAFT_5403 [Chthoniobacter flavus Ellin428]
MTALRLSSFLVLALLLAGLTGCESPHYTYHYVPGRTAIIRGGYAFAPPGAPERVERAIEAGNRIVGLPYRWGGGHGCSVDTGYDCSGSASFVLREAGLLDGCMVSKDFRGYGKSGEGDWIDVYAKNGHVFLAVAGVRFDTGWTDGNQGPQWTTVDRPANGCVVRHPGGGCKGFANIQHRTPNIEHSMGQARGGTLAFRSGFIGRWMLLRPMFGLSPP